MHRRGALSAVAGSIATLSLAGCLGSEDGSDDDPAALIESADESLSDATDELDAALEETNDPTSDGSATLDTEPIEARIDEAEADLTAAREDATDDQLETIDALEDAAAFLRDLVAACAALSDAMHEFETWEQYVTQNRWDDAVDAGERAESRNADAMDETTVARSSFEEIDTDALGAVDEVDRAEMELALGKLEGALEALDVLFEGGRRMAGAMSPFEDGSDALEAERFDEAATEFSTAADRFDRAHDVVSEAETEVESDYRSAVIDFSCQLEALRDAAEHYASGSEAYANGNTERGRSEFEDGEAALDRCDDGAVAPSMG